MAFLKVGFVFISVVALTSGEQNLQGASIRTSAEAQLLNSPKVTLYDQRDHTGPVAYFELGNASTQGGCFEVKSFSRIKSVRTYGTCVRLFRDEICRRTSFAIYPGSTVHPRDFLWKPIRSVGPCYGNEFQFSSFYKKSPDDEIFTATKNVSDHRGIPDVVDVSGADTYGAQSVSAPLSPSHPTTSYTLGPRNRTSYAIALVHRAHVHPGASFSPSESILQGWKWHSLIDKEEGDVLGFIIPPTLSGHTNDSYNIFPQSRRNFEEWTRVTSQVPDMVKNSLKTWYVEVHLAYPSNETTRPYGHFYRTGAYDVQTHNVISYGFIPN